jgi:N utilization substance protein B
VEKVASVEPEEEGLERVKLPPRRKARVVALMVLFEVDLTGHSPEECLSRLGRQMELQPRVAPFANALVSGVLSHRQELDRLIQNFAPAWPVSQLSVVDRNLLRLAIHEITGEAQTPPKAAINEAVELAKLFGSDSSSRFINGVLGSVLESLKKQAV